MTISAYPQILLYVSIAFTLIVFWKACRQNAKILTGLLVWLSVHGLLAYHHFYENTDLPPRFALIVLPTAVLMVFIFNHPKSRQQTDNFSLKWLTLMHLVRVPVELMLYRLFAEGVVPELMTFSGRNFDIVAGLTTPIVYYLFFVKKKLSQGLMLGWQVVCLLLVINIAVQASLSAPFPFQQFGFEQPNIAITRFPLSGFRL